MSASEILLGVLGVSGFVAIAYMGGQIREKLVFRKHERAMAPLIALVEGTMKGDSSTFFLEGVFGGNRVLAALSPMFHDSVFTDETWRRAFEVTIPDVGGASDWSVECRKPLTLGPRRWEIETADDRVRARLAELDLVPALQAAGIRCWLRYDAKGRWLRSSTDVRDGLAPSASEFEQQIMLLQGIAKLNPEIGAERATR